MFREEPIKISKTDIFNYVVGKSQFDPVEHCIDPTRYEVQENFIYDHDTKSRQQQTSDFTFFNKEIYKLREVVRDPNNQINPAEIIEICKEVGEMAPTKVRLPEPFSSTFDYPMEDKHRKKIQKLFGKINTKKFGDAKKNSDEN